MTNFAEKQAKVCAIGRYLRVLVRENLIGNLGFAAFLLICGGYLIWNTP